MCRAPASPLARVAALLVALVAAVASATGAGTAHVGAAPSGQSAAYIPIDPLRVIDTRGPGGTTLGAGETLAVAPVIGDVAAAAGVTVDEVEAVAINLVVVDTRGGGYTTAWATGEPQPNVSSINNVTSGETVANLVIVPLGVDDTISVFSHAGADIVIDVQGVFRRATERREGRYVGVRPTRVLDTRIEPPGAIPPGGTIDVELGDAVPASASAVVLNVAATDTLGGGYATVWASGRPRPDPAANLNFPTAGYQVANSVITGIGDGKVSIYSSVGNHVVVDVVGYVTGATASLDDAGLFVPISPHRFWDSRPDETPFGTSPIAAGTEVLLPIAGSGGVPAATARAITMNLTMTQTAGGGYLEVFPGGTTRPQPYASVNATFAGQDVGNHAVSGLDQGAISLYSSGGTHAVVDVTGYFLDGLPPAVVPAPPPDDDYDYLIRVSTDSEHSPTAPYERDGVRYLGWNPCDPITYAVHSIHATQADVDTLDEAVRLVENASGFDFQYVGEATGSLDTGTGVEAPAGAMVVIGLSTSQFTPVLAGGVVGVGGVGAGSGENVELGGDGKSYVVRGGFAIADLDDLDPGDELLATLIHELGHTLGLAHVDPDDEVMYRFLPVPPSVPLTAYGTGDENGLYSVGQPQCAGSGALRREGGAPTGETVVAIVAD